MSPLEIAILAAFGALLFGANSLASLRCLRTLGRHGLPYLALIWLTPPIGALYVLAKIRPEHHGAFTPIETNTINPRTIQGDPWPTLSQPLPPQSRRRR
jgi:hypothetical protein